MNRYNAVLKRWMAVVAVAVTLPVCAQDSAPKVDVSFNVRADFSVECPKGKDNTAGFKGSYLNLMIKGELTPQLSYSYRQRLNKFDNFDGDVFAATDWVYLNYKPSEHWVLSGGKQIVAVGGWEYDAAPIDIYYSSLFWQNIYCYQFGVSGTYVSNDGKHSLLLQFCNSPYYKKLDSSCFAYNLLWSGNMGCWKTLWSANLLEYERGHFAQYVVLGNRFGLGAVTLDVDLMARHYEKSNFFDNFSIVVKTDWRVNEAVNVFVKGGYESFKGDFLTDVECRKPFASAGIETRPIKKYRGVRLHAVYGLTTYTGEFQHNALAGVTWHCNVFKK